MTRPTFKPQAKLPAKQKAKQQGIALIAVLWLVSALGIMLVGMMYVMRGEIRIASQTQRATLDTGIADAAIRLTLQQLQQANSKSFKAVQSFPVEVFGRSVQVDVIPLNGFISLNDAPLPLLAAAFQFGAGVPAESAQPLANAIDQERKKPTPKGTPNKFQSVEDLLRIPGITYGIFAQTQDLFTVDISNSPFVNPLAASSRVLAVLGGGDPAKAEQVMAARVGKGEGADTTGLQFVQNNATSYVMLKATLQNSDNRPLVRVWRVDLQAKAYGLPWRMLGAEAPVHLGEPPIQPKPL